MSRPDAAAPPDLLAQLAPVGSQMALSHPRPAPVAYDGPRWPWLTGAPKPVED